MGRTYRTSKGRAIDMEALRHKNEKVVAAGNMKVNAKGDELGKGGVVVKTVREKATAPVSPKQTAYTSVKPALKKKEPEKNVKTREDGTQYKENILDDGTIVVEEVAAQKSTKTKRSNKKRPTI